MTKPAQQVASESLIISNYSTLISVVKHFGLMLMHFFCYQCEISIKEIFVFFLIEGTDAHEKQQ